MPARVAVRRGLASGSGGKPRRLKSGVTSGMRPREAVKAADPRSDKGAYFPARGKYPIWRVPTVKDGKQGDRFPPLREKVATPITVGSKTAMVGPDRDPKALAEQSLQGRAISSPL